MSGARDIELSVNPIDNERSIADKRVADAAGFNMTGAVIEVEPPKVMLVNPHYHQLLKMAILVAGQWRLKVERCDLVFIKVRSDYLVRMLA